MAPAPLTPRSVLQFVDGKSNMPVLERTSR